jgi:hypothetical protein
VDENQRQDELVKLRAPLRNAEISLIDRGGDEVRLVELRIREGKRITTIELDPGTAKRLATTLTAWAERSAAGGA